MKSDLTLDRIPVGEAVTVAYLGESGIRRRLTDIGLVRGAETVCIGESPLGDPRAYLIDGAVIALRRRDCSTISVIRQGDNGENG